MKLFTKPCSALHCQIQENINNDLGFWFNLLDIRIQRIKDKGTATIELNLQNSSFWLIHSYGGFRIYLICTKQLFPDLIVYHYSSREKYNIAETVINDGFIIHGLVKDILIKQNIQSMSFLNIDDYLLLITSDS